MSQPERGRPASRQVGPASVVAGVLILAAIAFPLIVPMYAHAGPTLWGFPFFYWYQLLWVFIAAALVSIAYRLVLIDERRRRAARRAERGAGHRAEHRGDGDGEARR